MLLKPIWAKRIRLIHDLTLKSGNRLLVAGCWQRIGAKIDPNRLYAISHLLAGNENRAAHYLNLMACY